MADKSISFTVEIKVRVFVWRGDVMRDTIRAYELEEEAHGRAN